jgi:hypothetical protein
MQAAFRKQIASKQKEIKLMIRKNKKELIQMKS